MNLKLIVIAAVVALLVCDQSANAQQQQPSPTSQASGGGGKPVEPTFRAVRSVSGSKVLEQGGRYAVEDPRTVFYAPADRQVIVYFTWEGPAGAHHFEGLWKNPDGKVAMTSDFDYTPEQPPDRRLSIDQKPYTIQFLQIYDRQHGTEYAEKATAIFFQLANAIVQADGSERPQELMTLLNFKDILDS